ncbi:MAG: glutathione S-transferase family protein [Gammaproteobacteria bacterium]|nr:glutathione S-transferase family protein [Gammaproteobacteria bacterium]
MHLYTQSASPNGQRVSIFLKEKGIELPMTQIDLRAGENLGEEYRAKNPFGRIPVLELDDGSYLSESQAICRFIEGLHPDPNFFGTTSEEQAIIEMWSRRVELNVMMPVAQAFRNITGFFKDREKVVPEWGEVAAQAAKAAVAIINDHLADNEYLTGNRYTIADMILAITLNFAKNVGQDLLAAERIARWHAQVAARPAFA